jgi:hypothetical protein
VRITAAEQIVRRKRLLLSKRSPDEHSEIREDRSAETPIPDCLLAIGKPLER